MIPNSNSPATSNNNDGSVGAGNGGGGGGGGSNGGSSAGSLKKGPWTAAEDGILMDYVKKHGEGNWNAVQKNSGLSRCGKSCRLRWANHLRPNLKKGSFSPEEERLILELHSKLGNKWARMAAQLPGRTDNEIKNYWNTRVKRRQRAGLPLYPQDIQKQAAVYHFNQINQPRSFQSAPPQASAQHPSSQQQQQQQQTCKPNFGSPLPLLDPVNFPVTGPLLGHHPAPYLPPPFHRYKRFRDNNCIGFSLPFSANPPQQQNQPPPLYSQGLNSQLLTASSFQLSSSNFDFNPPPPILGTTPFDSDSSSPFSTKLELPSDQQLSQPADEAAALGSINDFKMISPLGRGSSSGLLDALFQESQAIVETEDSRRDALLEEKCELDGLVSVSKAPPSGSIFDNNTTPPLASASQWDDSSSVHSSPALQIKKEGNDGMNSLEDLSFLDFMPTVRVPDLYSDSGEMSNGQSSGVTDDEIRLDWPNWNNITSTC